MCNETSSKTAQVSWEGDSLEVIRSFPQGVREEKEYEE